jgi:hypothetical protein
MASHYLWENQGLDRFTCHVVLSTLNPAEIRKQLETVKNDVVVDEDMNVFAVTYSKQNGVSFNKPHFEVRILSKEGVKNADKFERGVKMINEGAQRQIQGTMGIIESVVRMFTLFKKTMFKDVTVFSDGQTTTFRYKSDLESSVQVYSNDTKTTKTRTAQGELETTDRFFRLNGKLAPKTTTTSIRHGQDTSIVTTTIQYEKFGKIFLPTVVQQHTLLASANGKQQVETKFELTGCKVHQANE